ncbi:MAG: hypothetical protein HQL50_16395, partial [Magnetococcales bacterium]|nr:hypothetical protein [Magnetococcales bacterium]
EDNGIAQSTPTRSTLSGDIDQRMTGFGLPCRRLEIPDALELAQIAQEETQEIRNGSGPRVLWIRSVRLGPHSKGDDTRPQEEIEQLRTQDPVERLMSRFSTRQCDQILESVQHQVEHAVASAESAPFPEAISSESLFGRDEQDGSQIWWGRTEPSLAPLDADEPDETSHAILEHEANRPLGKRLNAALHAILEGDVSTHVLGEDIVDPYGGAFKITNGLSSTFPERVHSTPISEAAIVGLSGGMALGGVTPIAEIMFGDFLGLAMDQLVNHLALFRTMYDRQVKIPAIIRTPMGGRRGYGPTHSQTLDGRFLGITGLRVVAPSSLHPVQTLLKHSLAHAFPTLWLENKRAYTERYRLDDDGLVDDFHVRHRDPDGAGWLVLSLSAFCDEEATLIGYGGMLAPMKEAAKLLLIEDEISVRILLPARLHPFDGQGLHRLCVPGEPVIAVEEGAAPYGFGSEIAALLAEQTPALPFARVGAVPTAIAASRTLEDQILPDADTIRATVLSRLKSV